MANKNKNYVEMFLNMLPDEARTKASDHLVQRQSVMDEAKRYYGSMIRGEQIDDKATDDPIKLSLQPKDPKEMLAQQELARRDDMQAQEAQVRQSLTPNDDVNVNDFGIPPPQQQQQQLTPINDPATEELQGVVSDMENDPAYQAVNTIEQGGDLSDIPLGNDDLASAMQVMNNQPPTANMAKHLGGASMKYQSQQQQPPPPQQQPPQQLMTR